MSDSWHWIVVDVDKPREVTEQELLTCWAELRDKTRLVPGRVWREWQKRTQETEKYHDELRTFAKPMLRAVSEPPKSGSRFV